MTQSLTILFTILSFSAFAQVQSTESLRDLLQDELDRIPPALTENYSPPLPNEIITWEDIIEKIFTSDYAGAALLAEELDYELLEIDSEPSGLMYMLRRQANSSNYWGTYVYNPNNMCTVPLVIQAPHPRADLNTGDQAIHTFIYSQARALFISGTHRCNSTDPSSCDGSSSVCTGSSDNYRESDPAHAVDHIFHSTTEVMNDQFPESVFVQLHGFAKRDTDPYVILSNGTSLTATSDYSSSFRDFLLEEDNSLTFKIAHIDTDWTRLIGTTNVQGRLVNNSVDACTEASAGSSGRFMHVEQEFDKLRSSTQMWYRVARAISKTFDCAQNPVLGLQKEQFPEMELFPNPFREQIRVEIDLPYTVKISIWNGKGILIHQKTFEKNLDLALTVAPGIYYYRIDKDSRPLKTGKIIKL